MRHARRVDGNHAEIEAVFRKMLADHVTNTSKWGDGAGDLFVSFGQVCCFIEIKRDAKSPYTAAQVAFQRTHPWAVRRVDCIEQAIEVCRSIRAASARTAK